MEHSLRTNFALYLFFLCTDGIQTVVSRLEVALPLLSIGVPSAL